MYSAEAEPIPKLASVAKAVWAAKYKLCDPKQGDEQTIWDSFQRVATSLASSERDQARWKDQFLRLLRSFKFLPGGRILAGAGAGVRDEVTLLNCFVLPIDDETFVSSLEDGLKTMRAGGGVGYDFSRCHPRSSCAPGVVALMHSIDRECSALRTRGARRGALMATLRCDHPDIEEFAAAKLEGEGLSNFNLSVLVSDAFLAAVRADDAWMLSGPGGQTVRSLSARQLWLRISRCAYDSAEPGVLFIDRINRLNNLGYCEYISATNPCGEVPLPPFGACDLGSLNLPRFVQRPFDADASMDEAALERAVPIAIRMLDNVIDLSRYPLDAQEEVTQSTRRIGLGVMGLADALTMLGLRYDSEAARTMAGRTMRLICNAAYRASVELAAEKGPFPVLDRARYLRAPFVAALPGELKQAIRRRGIRNSHLLAIAPTGSISLLAGAVSSGIEPAFAADYRRRITTRDGSLQPMELTDYAVTLWRRSRGRRGVPPSFMSVGEVEVDDQLAMQACLQRHVDNAISKTVAVPSNLSFDNFSTVYERAFDLGLKGCTAFRYTSARRAVLSRASDLCDEAHRR